MATRKIGRDAGSGKFMPVKDAQAKKGSAIVQTLKTADKGKAVKAKPKKAKK